MGSPAFDKIQRTRQIRGGCVGESELELGRRRRQQPRQLGSIRATSDRNCLPEQGLAQEQSHAIDFRIGGKRRHEGLQALAGAGPVTALHLQLDNPQGRLAKEFRRRAGDRVGLECRGRSLAVSLPGEETAFPGHRLRTERHQIGGAGGQRAKLVRRFQCVRKTAAVFEESQTLAQPGEFLPGRTGKRGRLLQRRLRGSRILECNLG
jgi:hypothetical protein